MLLPSIAAAWLLLSSAGAAFSLGQGADDGRSVKGCQNTTPTATIRNGTYGGVCNANYKQDFFFGMPFAQVCSADPKLVAL
jgi:hypothetical protein